DRPPKGIGFDPVSARASPVLTSGPVVTFRLDALSAALSTGFSAGFGGAFVRSGTVTSGTFAAGCGCARGFASGGATACTERFDICVIPPAFGPTAPPSEIIIGVSFFCTVPIRHDAGLDRKGGV